jgi:MFS family permease
LVNSVDEALDQINENGKFDWSRALPLGMGYAFGLTYILPYMIQMPKLQCSQDNDNIWQSCDRSDVCHGTNNLSYRVNENSSETLHNWITHLDLLCISNFKIGLFGSLYFVGFVIGAVTLLRLGDSIGRKPVLLFTSLCSMAVFALLFFASNLYLIYGLIMIAGWLGIARGSLFYLYMLEMVPNAKRARYHCYLMTAESIGGMLTAGLFYMFKNAKLAFLVLLGWYVVHFFFLIRVPESPKFLYAKKKWKQTHESLAKIAEVNGLAVYKLKFKDEAENILERESNDISMLQALKDKIFLSNIWIMAFNWAVCSLSFYIIGYYVGRFPGNIFMNGFIMSWADLVSAIASGKYIKLLGFNYGFISSYSLVVTIVLVYFFTSGEVVAGYVCVFIMRLGIGMTFNMCYFGNSEIFEAKIKARSYAFCNFFARILTITSPMIVAMIPNPMFVVALMTLFSGFFSLFLQKPKEELDNKLNL